MLVLTITGTYGASTIASRTALRLKEPNSIAGSLRPAESHSRMCRLYSALLEAVPCFPR